MTSMYNPQMPLPFLKTCCFALITNTFLVGKVFVKVLGWQCLYGTAMHNDIFWSAKMLMLPSAVANQDEVGERMKGLQ